MVGFVCDLFILSVLCRVLVLLFVSYLCGTQIKRNNKEDVNALVAYVGNVCMLR